MPKTWTWNRPASLADLQDNRVFTWTRLPTKTDVKQAPAYRPTLLGVAPPATLDADGRQVVRVKR